MPEKCSLHTGFRNATSFVSCTGPAQVMLDLACIALADRLTVYSHEQAMRAT